MSLLVFSCREGDVCEADARTRRPVFMLDERTVTTDSRGREDMKVGVATALRSPTEVVVAVEDAIMVPRRGGRFARHRIPEGVAFPRYRRRP